MTVYVSGDDASRDVVRAIAERARGVDVAVLHAGAVQVPHRFDDAYVTLSSERAAEATKILGARAVVPIHYEGRTPLHPGADALRGAFAGNQVTDRPALAGPGASVTV
jgi:L-ascorbate metabolism protein UlaG (beta-lactamase superfamily)